ncbi:hypothetical protein Ae201684_016347 [Aphanomyces euteiches]|uniref:Leucine-rich repeat-containing N-terminal plant-type domain-containing protein n=1 Tax=Aphanomyces euteiches TaxID=100861 RepID=A0A6G0WFF4_9STRA|nr:hypothetical protein Ae201684_016347 [Aphanomyces euteiches]
MVSIAVFRFFVAASTGVAHASRILTLCSTSNNVQVPCLNDTIQGNTTFPPVQNNSSTYNFSNLNISSIQALPPSATSIDLSWNQIREIACPIPSSLNLLNLSHNALLNRWIQTLVTVQTLDVSYNLGGLPWNQNLLWAYLPKLQRLYFRGNNLSQLALSYANFPPNPFNALDLNDNPSLLLTVDSSVYNRITSGGVKLALGSNSYNSALTICGQNSNFVRGITSSATDGDAYPTSNRVTGLQTVYICYWGYYDSYDDKDSKNTTFESIAVAFSICVASLVLLSFFWRLAVKCRDGYALYNRDTICSSNCSKYNDPSTTANHAIYIQQPATPHAN